MCVYDLKEVTTIMEILEHDLEATIRNKKRKDLLIKRSRRF